MNPVQRLMLERIASGLRAVAERGLLTSSMFDPDRLTCPYATYIYNVNPLIVLCRCVICTRCGEHTGNSNQGHFWAYCKVTHTFRAFHFCCPDQCELEQS